MRRRVSFIALLIATAALAAVQPVTARSPRLVIAGATAPALREGVSRIEGALAYRPPGPDDEPRPLLLLFHGAGGSPLGMLQAMIPQARRCGCLLLALSSQGTTWDLVTATAAARRRERPARLDGLFGEDASRVERALTALLGSPSVDRRRIVLIGFSDGASYALSLALANPGLVRGAVAIAPGFHVEPGTIDPAQRLFIAHSPEDRVLSFAYSRDRIAASLRSAGFDPAFHSYRGGHAFDPEAVRLGIGHVLGADEAVR